jgi:hypothetical protein
LQLPKLLKSQAAQMFVTTSKWLIVDGRKARRIREINRQIFCGFYGFCGVIRDVSDEIFTTTTYRGLQAISAQLIVFFVQKNFK